MERPPRSGEEGGGGHHAHLNLSAASAAPTSAVSGMTPFRDDKFGQDEIIGMEEGFNFIYDRGIRPFLHLVKTNQPDDFKVWSHFPRRWIGWEGMLFNFFNSSDDAWFPSVLPFVFSCQANEFVKLYE